jgi:hypothetical protein
MVDTSLPGHLHSVSSPAKWLGYLLKSDLSAEHKLCGVVVSRMCSYNRNRQLFLSAISNYTISRIVKMNSEQVQSLLDDLIRLGWLHDTGLNTGAKKIYGLTFSLIPLGEMKR